MKAITFSLKTIQPILATSFQGDPNSDVSYPYIPGSMIRGVLISRYLKRNGLQNTDILTDATIKRLFFDGTTSYLNAYLGTQNGQRTLPSLLSWRKEKGAELKDDSDSITVYDVSVSKAALESPKLLGEVFWIDDGRYVRLDTVKRRINIHNLRDRSKGRSTESEGEIFRYDAIDTGQTFQGVILCSETDEHTILDLLQPSDIWVGGSRSAGYGHLKITINQPNSDVPWNEVNISAENRIHNNFIKLTLLSDLIIRDECGQYSAVAPTHLLSKALNIKVKQPKIAYTSCVFIGGFNRKWGLPLPQVLALQAGSVFIFESDNLPLTSQQIYQLETEGIGERREEGFGRIAVNWRLEENQFQFTAKKPEVTLYSKRDKPQLQKKQSCDLADQMAERILRQKLENLILDKLTYFQLKGNITNNQLSRLMIVAREGLTRKSRLPVFRLLRYLPSNSRKKFQQTQVIDKAFDRLIYEWIRHPKSWMGNTSTLEVEIAGVKQNVTQSLAIEYTLRLIIAIAKNAMKEKTND